METDGQQTQDKSESVEQDTTSISKLENKQANELKKPLKCETSIESDSVTLVEHDRMCQLASETASSAPDAKVRGQEEWQSDPQGLNEVIETLSPEQFPDYVRKNDSTLTFPEKLMLMLIHVEKSYAKQGKKLEDQSISWSANGKSFVIRDKDALCKTWVTAFFGQAKFSSFTRKLYRWGFRKVNVSINEKGVQIVVFSNENFQRNDVSRLVKMQSTTAAKIRNQLAVKSGPRKEPTPEYTNVQTAETLSEQPSVIDQLLRERFSLTNPSILQFHQGRDPNSLKNKTLHAKGLDSAQTISILPSMDGANLMTAHQQNSLNHNRLSTVSPLPSSISLEDSSSIGLSLAARSQLESLRLLEALDRARSASIASIPNIDSSFDQLLLQRGVSAQPVPSIDFTRIPSSLDPYGLIQLEIENSLRRQPLLGVQRTLSNRSSEDVDRRYLVALAAMLHRQNNYNNR